MYEMSHTDKTSIKLHLVKQMIFDEKKVNTS